MPDLVSNRAPFFVNSHLLPAEWISYVSPPWSEDAEEIPKGKQHQLYFLAEVLNRYRPLPGIEHVCQHHPLLSQPLIELCLRIPTYLLLDGGRQRGLARDAFSSFVPPDIIRREDKGDNTYEYMSFIRRSESFIRDLLLNGFLVRENIASRSELESCIGRKQPMRMEHFFPLMACIAAEIWVQSWTGGHSCAESVDART